MLQSAKIGQTDTLFYYMGIELLFHLNDEGSNWTEISEV